MINKRKSCRGLAACCHLEGKYPAGRDAHQNAADILPTMECQISVKLVEIVWVWSKHVGRVDRDTGNSAEKQLQDQLLQRILQVLLGIPWYV